MSADSTVPLGVILKSDPPTSRPPTSALINAIESAFDFPRLPCELQKDIADIIADDLIRWRVYCHGGTGIKTPAVLLAGKQISKFVKQRMDRFLGFILADPRQKALSEYPVARTIIIPVETRAHTLFFDSAEYKAFEANPAHTIRIIVDGSSHIEHQLELSMLPCEEHAKFQSRLRAAKCAQIEIVSAEAVHRFRGRVTIDVEDEIPGLGPYLSISILIHGSQQSALVTVGYRLSNR